jgi:acyl carrier protein
VLAIDYSAWRDVGLAAALFEGRPEAREEFLRWAIPPETGADALARALASGRSRVIVSPFDVDEAVARARAPLGREAPRGGPPAGAAPRPVATERTDAAPYDAPGSEGERALAAIWAELLGVERIGLDDDFFALGGHSLLATRVLARVEHTLGVRLTLRDVFDAPTIRLLAAKVAAARTTAPGGGEASPDREELEF